MSARRESRPVSPADRDMSDKGLPGSETADAEATAAPVPAGVPGDDRFGRDHGDLAVAMSPRQIIGGFALLAGLILMLRRRRRKD